MSDPGVCAIVVSYNVRELLLPCIASLMDGRASGALARIIVVDNASTDGSPDAVRTAFPQVTVIDAPNRGYGAGANIGIQASTEELVLVLNPDTVVPNGTIETLSTYLREHPHAAIAAPRLRYPDGAAQSSRRRFPGRLTPVFESTAFERWWPGNRWSRRYRVEDRTDDVVQEVDWIVGACLMVRREAIDVVGGFDESFWMYCEETELCWRMRKHGWRIAYLPDIEITHHEGASTGQNVARRQLAFDRSRVELQRRIHGPASAWIAAAGIRAGYLAQLLVEAAKYALGHRRAMRRQRIGMYARLVTSSLRFRQGPPL